MSRACVTLIAVVCFLVAVGHARSDVPKKELKELQGEWRVTQGVKAGEAAEEDVLNMMRAVIVGNKVTFSRKETNSEKVIYEFTIEGIDATKNPKTIDLEIENEKVAGIYKLDKGMLTLCIGKERPTTFESKQGTFTALFVLTRQPKK